LVKNVWRQDNERVVVYKIGEGRKEKVKKKSNTTTNPDFICIFRDNWNDLVRKKELTFAERGVLMSLIGFTNWRSNILVHPETGQVLNESGLSKLLNCNRAHLSEHLISLYQKGLIAIIKTGDGRPNKYMMNSNLSIFGKTLKDNSEHEVFRDVDWKPIKPIVFKDEKKRLKD
jgi:hypothetical protein